jgi:Zn-dependent oligopeptidase
MKEALEKIVVDLTREALELEGTELNEEQKEILKQVKATLSELSLFALQFVEGGKAGKE